VLRILVLLVVANPLIDAGKDYDLVKHGKRNGFLDVIAQRHADDMARRDHQDHEGFEEKRVVAIRKVIVCEEVSEICAESEGKRTVEEAAKVA
jgi:hypothetical protein